MFISIMVSINLAVGLYIMLTQLRMTCEGTSGKQKEIRANYIRSINFYLDVMAVLPLEIFAPAFSDPWKAVPVLKLNRLLKLWKVNSTYGSMCFNCICICCSLGL